MQCFHLMILQESKKKINTFSPKRKEKIVQPESKDKQNNKIAITCFLCCI